MTTDRPTCHYEPASENASFTSNRQTRLLLFRSSIVCTASTRASMEVLTYQKFSKSFQSRRRQDSITFNFWIFVFFEFLCFHLSYATPLMAVLSPSIPDDVLTGEGRSDIEELHARNAIVDSATGKISGIELSKNFSFPQKTPKGVVEDVSEIDTNSREQIKFQKGTYIWSENSRNLNNKVFLEDLVVSGRAQSYADRLHVDFQNMLYVPSDSSLYAVAKDAALLKLDAKTMTLMDAYVVPSQPQASIYCQAAAGCKQRKMINVLAQTPNQPFVFYCSLHYEEHPRRRLIRHALTGCAVPNPRNLDENILMWDNAYYTSMDPNRPPVILTPTSTSAFDSSPEAFMYVAGVNSNLQHIGRLRMPDWATGDIDWDGALFNPKQSVFSDEPATVIMSFETETSIYFLMREMSLRHPTRFNRLKRHRQAGTRLVRVCRGDQGGLPGIAEHYFGTMARAEIFCRSEVTSSVFGSGDDGRLSHFTFEYVQSAHWDVKAKRLYAVFSAGEAAPNGSALCVYDLLSIEKAFRGPVTTPDRFYHRSNPLTSGYSRINPFPDICERFSRGNLTAEEESLGQMGANFMYRYEPVAPLFGHAVAMSSSTTWISVIGYQLPSIGNPHIVTSVLWLVSASQLLQLAFYESHLDRAQLSEPTFLNACELRRLHIGQENDPIERLRVGKKQTEIRNADFQRHDSNRWSFPVEEVQDSWQEHGVETSPQLPYNERIKNILREGDFIFLSTTHQIYRFPTDTCAVYATMEKCVASGDSHCGWSLQVYRCVSLLGQKQTDQIVPAAERSKLSHCPSHEQSTSNLVTRQSGWSEWRPCPMMTALNENYVPSPEEMYTVRENACLCRICLSETLCDFGETQVSQCTVAVVWTPWSSWSRCEEKLRYRTRTCFNLMLGAIVNPSECPGPSKEEEFCPLHHPLIPNEIDFREMHAESVTLKKHSVLGFVIERNQLVGMSVGIFIGIVTTLAGIFIFLCLCHRRRRFRIIRKIQPQYRHNLPASRSTINAQLEAQIRNSLQRNRSIYGRTYPSQTSFFYSNNPRYHCVSCLHPSTRSSRDSNLSADATSTSGFYDRVSP